MATHEMSITVEGDKIEKENSFYYLGTKVTWNKQCEEVSKPE